MLFATGDNHPLVVHVSQMKEEVQRQIRNWHRLIVVFRLRRTLVSKMADQQWNRNLLSKIVDLLHWRRRDDVVRVVRNLLAYMRDAVRRVDIFRIDLPKRIGHQSVHHTFQFDGCHSLGRSRRGSYLGQANLALKQRGQTATEDEEHGPKHYSIVAARWKGRKPQAGRVPSPDADIAIAAVRRPPGLHYQS